MLNSKLIGSASLACAVTMLIHGVAYAQTEPAADKTESLELEEVTVTGSRLQISSSYTSPTPVTALSAEDIETRGFSSAIDATQEIPAFRSSAGATRVTGGTMQVGQGLMDLRGLGPVRTLVLVDSRRFVPTQATGTWDSNVLPVSLIERTDVVTGGASAAYGSDAVAGVVNLVLNDKLEGFKTNVQYGDSEHRDAARTRVGLALGQAFAGGRGHVIFGADYSETDPAGTIYSRDWGRKEPGAFTLGTRPAGQPAVLVAENVRLSVPPGSLVTSCRTLAGPLAPCPIAGLTFNSAGQPVPFQFGSPRSGVSMVGGGNEGYSQYRNALLQIESDRWAALSRATFDFTDNLTGWVEASGGRFHIESRTVDYLNTGSIVIQNDNPFIPTALAAQMTASGITSFNLARLNYDQLGGLHASNVNNYWQGAAGVKGTVFDDWSWDAYFSSGRSKFYYKPSNMTVLPNYFAALYVVRDANGNPTCGPTATNPMLAALPAAQRALVGPGCVPFNPFGPRAESQAALDYVAPDAQSLTTFDRQSAALNFAGSPFNTWAGEAALAVGVEWRSDDVETTLNARDAQLSRNSAFAAANPQPGEGSQSVREGYVEIGLPLASDLPAAKSLDLNAAARYTDYSVTGGVTTWKGGLTWDINDSVRLRATRSRDIRAPNIPELFYRGNDGFLVATNPITGGANTINTAALANPNLEPEEADTWTAGIVLQPSWSWAEGLTASIDYFEIDLQGVIGVIDRQAVINGYYRDGRQDYAQYFTFDPNAPAGFTRIDIPQLNLNSQKTHGVDLNIAYLIPASIPGLIAVNVMGSYLGEQQTVGPNGEDLGDLADVTPKYRVTTNINYTLNNFSTTLTARYNSKFHWGPFFNGPDEAGYNPALASSANDNDFPSAIYYSLQGEYAVRDTGDQKVVLYAIVDNLLDKDPPEGAYTRIEGLGSPSNGAAGYSPYDVLGRFFSVGVRANF